METALSCAIRALPKGKRSHAPNCSEFQTPVRFLYSLVQMMLGDPVKPLISPSSESTNYPNYRRGWFPNNFQVCSQCCLSVCFSGYPSVPNEPSPKFTGLKQQCVIISHIYHGVIRRKWTVFIWDHLGNCSQNVNDAGGRLKA